MFSMESNLRLYNEKPTIVEADSDTFFAHVEAGSNTSTVTLRVVEGNEKGSLKTETVKYGKRREDEQEENR
jgi:hypothetical protein